MSRLFLLSEKQMSRISPFFPLAHGVPRVDDRRILSGIAALVSELDNGGREALHHHLMNVDLTGFNVRAVPKTDALARQKEESWPLEQKWLHEVLFRGYFATSIYGCEELEMWHSRISCNLVADSFEKYARARGKLAYARSANRIGQLLASVGFSHERIRAQNTVVVGEVCTPGDRRGQIRHNSGRAYAYTAASLKEVRAGFDALVGFSVDWTGGVDGDDQVEDTWQDVVARARELIGQAETMMSFGDDSDPIRDKDKLDTLRRLQNQLLHIIGNEKT